MKNSFIKINNDRLSNSFTIKEMKDAILCEQLEVWFQPQYNLVSGALIGSEALVRWYHPTKGFLMPLTFLPSFENKDMIYELDKYVWKRCCELIKRWKDNGYMSLPISINISIGDLIQDDFFNNLTHLIRSYDIPPKMLHLDLSEEILVEVNDSIIELLNRLIDYGFILEIGGFGSNSSCINLISNVPIQILKLNMLSFTDNSYNNRNGNIIESIVHTAKWLDMVVIAEGVEIKEQVSFLKSIGCNYIIGFYFSKPMQSFEYEKLVKNGMYEPETIHMKTLINLDSSEFWNPKSIETLIFNSYIGGACICEYYNENIELLRKNEQFNSELGYNKYNNIEYNNRYIYKLFDEENKRIILDTINSAILEKAEKNCVLKISYINDDEHNEYIDVTLRVIAKNEERYLVYIVIKNITESQEIIKKKLDDHQRTEKLYDKLSESEIFGLINVKNRKVEKFRSLYMTEREIENFIEYNTYERSMKKYIYENEFDVVYEQISYDGIYQHYKDGDFKYSVEYRRLMPSGEFRWFKATIVIIEESYDIVYAFIYSKNIDTRKKRSLARNRIVDIEVSDITIVNIASEMCNVIDLYPNSSINTGESRYIDNLNRYINREVAEEDKELCREFFSIYNLSHSVKENGYAEVSYWINSYSGYNIRKCARVTYLDSTHEDLLIVGKDITSIYEKEQEDISLLQQTVEIANSANNAKSEFLSRMSHDLRTPLGAILSLVQLAQIEKNPDKLNDFLRSIKSSGEYMLGLINDTLDLNKIESGKMEFHQEKYAYNDFYNDILAVIKPLMDAKNIEFNICLNHKIKYINVDRIRFTQVFYNLLSNAAKYTPEGGKVDFISFDVPQKEGKFGLGFMIKDNGIGMSEEYMKVMFEPFSQEYSALHKERQGTGLGLAIVKKIIDESGGILSVTSRLNMGTVFTIKWYIDKTYDSTTEIVEASDVLRGTRILLADDNKVNRMIIRENLRQRGCIVETRDNGYEALQLFKLSDIGYYDIILTDLAMPLMDGFEEAAEIRKLDRKDAKTIPIIAATADAYSDIMRKINESGINARIIKPFTPETLIKLIVELLTCTYESPFSRS